MPKTNMTDEIIHDIACAILLQASLDWIALDYGRLGYASLNSGHDVLYRAEVESFFRSTWFETLLALALPQTDPDYVRHKMRIEVKP